MYPNLGNTEIRMSEVNSRETHLVSLCGENEVQNQFQTVFTDSALPNSLFSLPIIGNGFLESLQSIEADNFL